MGTAQFPARRDGIEQEDLRRKTESFHPSWWNEEQHGSAWARAKEALRRDWEQTKNDFTPGAPDMRQDVDDTVRQAAGKQAIPPPGVRNAPSKGEVKDESKAAAKSLDKSLDNSREVPRERNREQNRDRGMQANRSSLLKWDDVESPYSYGYAARSHFASMYPTWGDGLETELKTEWERAEGNNDRNWADVAPLVRRGFEAPHTREL